MAKVLEALNSLVDSGEVLALEYLDQLEVPLLVNSAALTGSKNESNNSHIGEEDFLPVSYFAHQSRKLEETGGIVWDASFVLADYFVRNPDLVAGKRVLELGCGTGWLGSVVASLGCNVTVTDTDQYQDVVKQNIDHNSLMLCNRGLVRKGAVQVRFERLRWGEKNDEDSLQDGTGPFDVIIMADVVYNPEALELLEQTLDRLSTSAPSISIYLSQRTRFKIIEKHFLERLEKFFEITKVLEVTAKHYDPDTAVNVFRFALRN